MKIKILAHTPNPERVIALAGKLCYSQVGIDELNDKISDEQVEKFIKKLSDMGHMSPFEHASFTFAIEGISRNCSHQIVRHRLASFSQQSQRYVRMKGEYVVPPYIYWHEELLLEFNHALEDADKAYNKLVEGLMRYGRTEKEAIEDARYILPSACTTKMEVTMNVRELLHFFKQRCCKRAQWEIREVAKEMLKQCKEVSPILFKNAGAPCSTCTEGELKCK